MGTDPTSNPSAADAEAAHEADRPATPAEANQAEVQEANVSDEAGQHYKEMAERGAAVDGEGEIVPQDRSS